MYDYVIEQGETSWGAYVPELPGCVAVAESEDEVRVLILEAIQEHLELLNETVTTCSWTVSQTYGHLLSKVQMPDFS